MKNIKQDQTHKSPIRPIKTQVTDAIFSLQAQLYKAFFEVQSDASELFIEFWLLWNVCIGVHSEFSKGFFVIVIFFSF